MVRFGIIGTSIITEKFLCATTGIGEFRLTAVYSRDRAQAEEFGRAYGASVFYDDLEEFAKSDDFDAVYIASPNCCHCEQALLMLKNGKHVLCEKPIASNIKEAASMFDAAHENKVVLLEAMRSVFAPEFKQIRNYIKKLGTIRRVRFQMNQYSSRYNNFKKGIVENAFRPELSNGALMDLAGYCIYPMVFLFGLPSDVDGMGVFLDNGVDGAGTILLKYDHMIGEAAYSKVNYSVLPSEIQGEEASMIISGIASTRDITVRYNNGFKEVVHFDQQENNMEYEVRAFIDMIKGERSPHFYETASMNTATVMEEARKKMGIHFPADEPKKKPESEQVQEKEKDLAEVSPQKEEKKPGSEQVQEKEKDSVEVSSQKDEKKPGGEQSQNKKKTSGGTRSRKRKKVSGETQPQEGSRENK